MSDMDHDPDLPDAELFEDAPGAESDGGASLIKRMENVEMFAAILKDLRKLAVHGRKASGIEEIWQEDDDHYEGCDAYNRPHGMSKGRTTADVPTTTPKKVHGRSTAFANITRPYCDAGAARVADMLLPTDDRNWAIRHTPIPTMVNGKEDNRVVLGEDGQPLMRPLQPGEESQSPAPPQSPGMLSRIGGAVKGLMGMGQPEAAPAPEQAAPQQKPVTVADMAKQAIERAKASAERAQDEIDDWLVECQYHAEVRKVIESSARIGVGILKGPHPVQRTARAASYVNGKWALNIERKTAPASMFVSAWNFYPDPNCGEDIKKGAYTFEYDNLTAHALSDLKGGDYIDEMIDLCLEEGPVDTNDGTRQLKDGEILDKNALFGIWYFNGMVSKADMLAAGCDCDKDQMPCIVTMVNDRIIKIAQSPLDAGEFPYDVMVWQQKIGHWAGVGIARQMRTCQKGLNGAVRAMQDNMAISSGPQIVVDRSKVDPANGKWEFTPNKIWWSKPSMSDGDFDANKAFIVVSVETRMQELLQNIQYWTKAAEDVTGLPMLIQGQQGAAPETVGGMAMLNNNATSVLRRIARTFDNRITEPHIARYYEWLLIHGPEDAKGDFQIDARGSSALVERDIQNQAMMQLLGLAVNPAYSLDPENVMAEVLKGMRLDPSSFQMDEEKKAALAKQPPPEDPRVTAAKIMAESRGAQQQATLQHQAAEGEAERAIKQMALNIEAELGAAGLTAQQQATLNNIKATLSGITMKLQVQRELSGRSTNADLYKHSNPSPQVITPATEPAGRASAGKAFAE